MKNLVCLLALILALPTNAAVVLVYHHIAEDTPPSTSVSPERFEAHLKYLAENGYTVLPLADLLAMIEKDKQAPERSVAITFDDAYQSVHDTAIPMLAERGWPFTVFVNTEATSRTSSLYMDWADLARILEAGGDVQNHSHSHDSLAFPQPDEGADQWRARVKADITKAQTLIKDNLGVEATIFAYPYGEYSIELQKIVDELGLFGVGQHSGAIGTHSDFLGLPRHPFYTGADNLDRFATRVRTQPLYIQAQPRGPMRVNRNSDVSLSLSTDKDSGDLSSVNCFFDGKAVTIEEGELSNLGPFNKRRTKLNCTKALGSGVFGWWSYLFITP